MKLVCRVILTFGISPCWKFIRVPRTMHEEMPEKELWKQTLFSKLHEPWSFNMTVATTAKAEYAFTSTSRRHLDWHIADKKRSWDFESVACEYRHSQVLIKKISSGKSTDIVPNEAAISGRVKIGWAKIRWHDQTSAAIICIRYSHSGSQCHVLIVRAHRSVCIVSLGEFSSAVSKFCGLKVLNSTYSDLLSHLLIEFSGDLWTEYVSGSRGPSLWF